MAGVEGTGARRIIIERIPVENEPPAREVLTAVQNSEFFATMSSFQVSPSTIFVSGLLLIFTVLAVAWYLRGRRAGTQRALAAFEKSGRRAPRRRVRAAHAVTDYRALRKSRPIVPRPDPTREIYVLRPSPGSTGHPSGSG